MTCLVGLGSSLRCHGEFPITVRPAMHSCDIMPAISILDGSLAQILPRTTTGRGIGRSLSLNWTQETRPRKTVSILGFDCFDRCAKGCLEREKRRGEPRKSDYMRPDMTLHRLADRLTDRAWGPDFSRISPTEMGAWDTTTGCNASSWQLMPCAVSSGQAHMAN